MRSYVSGDVIGITQQGSCPEIPQFKSNSGTLPACSFSLKSAICKCSLNSEVLDGRSKGRHAE
jgi:hypothetical protein